MPTKRPPLSPEHKAAIGAGSKRRMAALTPEQRKLQSLKGVEGRIKAMQEWREIKGKKGAIEALLASYRTTLYPENHDIVDKYKNQA